MRKGFTLLELLIVIGILAVLATATVLVLNPAEYLRQARDTQRVTDLDSLKSALSLYVASVNSPAICTSNQFRCTFAGMNTFSTACSAASTSTLTSASGWVGVDLGAIPGGSPLPKLPIDPQNNSSTLAYGYACKSSNLTIELNAYFESDKYKTNDDLDGKDGGGNAAVYEIGTALDL